VHPMKVHFGRRTEGDLSELIRLRGQVAYGLGKTAGLKER
jgi:hypothetical protein